VDEKSSEKSIERGIVYRTKSKGEQGLVELHRKRYVRKRD